MTWWRKRTSERDTMRRALAGVTVRTELELAVHQMRQAFDQLESIVARMPEEQPSGE